MIKLPVSELKIFLSKSSHVVPAGTMGILEFVKITCEGDVATLTKTNLNSFVVHQVEAKFTKNFVLLVEFDILVKAAKSSQTELKISFKEQKSEKVPSGKVRVVTIEDGHLINLKSMSDDENLFPVIPSPKKDEVVDMTQEMIEAMFLSSTAALDVKGGLTLFQNYVHIVNVNKKRSYFCGFNNTIMYYKSFKSMVPSMVLEQTTCKAIKGYTSLQWYSGDKYNFFDAGKTLLGFIQTEVKAPDFMQIINTMEDSKSFTIDRKSMIEFCDIAIGINPMSAIEPCYFKQGSEEKLLMLDYENALEGKSNCVEMEVKKNKRHVVQKFLFQPDQMVLLLKDLPFEKVTLVGPCNHNFYVTAEDDPDYIGAIREVVFNNEVKNAVPAEAAKA
jgi:DNA polymerase III sliding clamp (beta) subunit (PCNA family)